MCCWTVKPELSVEPLVARWPLSDGCCGSALFSSGDCLDNWYITTYTEIYCDISYFCSFSPLKQYLLLTGIPDLITYSSAASGFEMCHRYFCFPAVGKKSDLVASPFSIVASAAARLIDSCCSASAAHGSVRAAMKETESVFLQQSKANFLVNSIWHVLTSCQSVLQNLHYS